MTATNTSIMIRTRLSLLDRRNFHLETSLGHSVKKLSWDQMCSQWKKQSSITQVILVWIRQLAKLTKQLTNSPLTCRIWLTSCLRLIWLCQLDPSMSRRNSGKLTWKCQAARTKCARHNPRLTSSQGKEALQVKLTYHAWKRIPHL